MARDWSVVAATIARRSGRRSSLVDALFGWTGGRSRVAMHTLIRAHRAVAYREAAFADETPYAAMEATLPDGGFQSRERRPRRRMI